MFQSIYVAIVLFVVTLNSNVGVTVSKVSML